MTIKILPPQLANQIAAGEVVERPASVIKELVENCLDAGATRVDIEIDKGGSKLIKIQDNGSGIAKDELALALSRHATSKLATLDDLDAILSFGFRGEALASISSVSRLTLTSRTKEQSEAWQAYAEGSQMAVKIVPAAHPVGTTLEVMDLFFNTPARRRFLKSDKTEFTHIDEWLKRIALVRRDIHFTLKHNGKMVRNYRPAMQETQYLQRLAQVSGRQFAEQALSVDCQHNGLQLTGYIQSPHFEVSSTDTQYFYVNGRLVRDRLVNHAVRQAFADQLDGVQVGYVLMLSLDPHQVDVNVHPAKHEVRFHESRYVHDFILQALQSALEQAEQLPLSTASDTAPRQGKQTAVEQSGYTAEQGSIHQIDAMSFSEKHSGREAAHSQTGEGLALLSSASASQNRVSDRAPGSYSGHSRYSEGRYNEGGHSGGSKESYRGTNLPSQAAIDSYAQLLSTPASQGRDVQYKDDQDAMPPLLDGKFWVLVKHDSLSLLSLDSVASAIVREQIQNKLPSGLISQPLLMPVSIKAAEDWHDTLVERELLFRRLGLELSIRLGQLIIKKVPPYLRQSQLADVIPELLQWIRFDEPSDEALVTWLVAQSRTQFSSAVTLWDEFCQLPQDKQQQIIQQAKVLPWQTWLSEQISDERQ
ncbi:DNA mismatch repair endonuclease MutL [Shewanella sp. AS1]|uniref:DNA mismatch repair endonuclease MutL n=1 Tax=Shewanella sp. AS1 TaxID=2907626 RepID=UPI001F19FEF2|nr:DNA mismatch repair endonuclease MutL [Shewanella sp. AS1]MCE9677614.1 DNA mismatch repair endonuclease MutL [Shewanella sp. AS1]